MNDSHKTFVLAFYDSFLKIELYFDKESMGQVHESIGIIWGNKTILVFSNTYMLNHDKHCEQGATELSRGGF